MIISLCGFMGAGKSTIGKYLARTVGFTFIDLDNYIEQKRGISIPELFRTEGEEAFREEEFESLQQIFGQFSQKKDLILSLGGGTVTRERCANLIREKTRCIYLYCSKEELARRVARNTTNRPLLQGKSNKELEDHIENLMKQREPLYRSCAHITIDTGCGNIPQIIDKLLNII
jgi:shikimate kinase